MEALREDLLQLAPFLRGREGELRDWNQISILTVQINRLRRWYRRGLLCIGDAAHAMSPVGGVGINLAIQDAVAAARLLATPLLERRLSEADLAAVQRRREFPARLTQAVQIFIHNRFAKAFEHPENLKAPWQMKLALQIPGFHRALGYAVGIGVRPEHVGEARIHPAPVSHEVARTLGAALGAAAIVSKRVFRSAA